MKKDEIKEKIKDYLEKAYDEIFTLNIYFESLNYLRGIEDFERKEVLVQTAPFFNFIYILMLQDLVLILDRYFADPNSQNGKRSLKWYLQQTKMHFDKFSDNEINIQLAKIDSVADEVSAVSAWRSKWFAHRDPKYYDNPEKITEDFPLLMEDIERLINIAKSLIEEHYSRLQQTGISWGNKEYTGIDTIFSFFVERNRTFWGIRKKFGIVEGNQLWDEFSSTSRTKEEIYENSPILKYESIAKEIKNKE